MSLFLRATKSALAPGLTASFGAGGGVEPYVYTVAPDGAGGTIDSDTGLYTAPAIQNQSPKLQEDTIIVTDDNGDTAELPIKVCTPLELFCDIIQKEMGLADGRVYIYNQKYMEPKDNGLYVAVGIVNPKPFGNTNKMLDSGESEQSVNMMTSLLVNAISRGPEALNRKEEIIMALNSNYSQNQQAGNSFFVAPITSNFVNLSEIDGAAIPFRFAMTVNIQYFVKKVKAEDYFDDFAEPEIETES
jgi:hypothetical protein